MFLSSVVFLLAAVTGVTSHTTEVTTLTPSATPTSGNKTASPATTPSLTTTTTATAATTASTAATTAASTTTTATTAASTAASTTTAATTAASTATTTAATTAASTAASTTTTATTAASTAASTTTTATTAASTAASTTTATTTAATTVTTLRPTEITTNPNSTTTAPPIPTLGPVIVCPTVPCPLESVCLNNTCQCLTGSFLQDNRCVPAQVFPGELHFMSLTFQPEMSNRSSSLFQETAANISEALFSILKNQKGYIRSDVVALLPGSIQASVNNIFEKDSTGINEDSVKNAIEKAISNAQSSNGFFRNVTFEGKDLCQQIPLPCEGSTAKCTIKNNQPSCYCLPEFISNVYSNTSCRACPSGERAVNNNCEQCPFGYAGFNCRDSSLLAVVVISCVLGGILLIMVLALLCWRIFSNNKPDYSSSPYASGDSNKPWPVGITPIPRASTNWDEAPTIEMTEGRRTGALVDNNHQTNGLSGSYELNAEGMRTFKGKNPSRYSYLVQGHENPYFLPGDGKKN
ncbi:protein HEG isoform X3 [Paralichthys olivaceus]|uniref:protein HEG isoform X3 n=1 Tax=Paralichthys olivaceus TaxID=8255 RepID=UPI0037503465